MTDTQHAPQPRGIGRMRDLAHAQNPALVAEAMRQEADRQRLRRLFGPTR
ncbi:hypothetical protein PBI_OMNICRON_88 [Mycobacterium phage Omnicron]|uniref:Uncharacterized protein n=2 Tax=Kratiovirus TaxID=2948788 RepID=A0A088FV70_9CAUD|nr:hypothetical protein PBI_OMNICRON_88 [Mycobacterium phage Omnicron]YP_009950983.1 hypothetical protein I5G75_gp11 [Mycobacterium phage Rando14]AIM50421.1 hypothetical protein PBI_OMNICRON_88 [Mycobacterium phage Omnicron]AXQ53105.1 hypothetical protein SEA_RANDO14_85 [Mycobacterium phage Rando14]